MNDWVRNRLVPRTSAAASRLAVPSVRSRSADGVHERRERARHRLQVVAEVVPLEGGVALAGQVDRDDGEVLRELGDDLSVGVGPQRAAGQQDHRRPAAGPGVVEPGDGVSTYREVACAR
jgi:hypothetical protein